MEIANHALRIYEQRMKGLHPNKYFGKRLNYKTLKWEKERDFSLTDIRSIIGPAKEPKIINASEHEKLLREKRGKKKADVEKRLYEKQFKINRKIVLILDNYQCRECGSKDNLHVHHIIERCNGGTNDTDNLITLCKDCHKQRHRKQRVFALMDK